MWNIRFLVISLLFYNKSYAESDWPKTCPEIVTKDKWQGLPSIAVDYVIIPVTKVVIHHTVTPECSTQETCSSMVKSIQNFHMESLEFPDIGYNFLVGGDGRIYEGAGWHKVGAHTRGYNKNSLGLAFIGNFAVKRPSNIILNAAKKFLECAVTIGELSDDYIVFGARQVSQTASPGIYLYNDLIQWPHFSRYPNTTKSA
ncbi:peptidoglycan-recognition protein 2-like [Diorhabda sublineata]|uniref:peptidoglycan-recognition protein 2-like n=1 Tax=Diorhabda sublineata TaxID=1163346 RepID=UPI0024E0A424|nr:peptidoglycan-recognition protein 2-like [Diorhabda sublineata]XP_056647460.1 peptidoglycan-recognition protein 2-like [Diorhabda sublineata]